MNDYSIKFYLSNNKKIQCTKTKKTKQTKNITTGYDNNLLKKAICTSIFWEGKKHFYTCQCFPEIPSVQEE